jgi:hypothetical protein
MLEQNYLCGVLHACWQTQDTVTGRNITGQYLIALLYEKFFVLAQPSGTQDEVYAIQACIPISELTVEDVDNGKGITNPFCLFSPSSMALHIVSDMK